MYIPHKTHTCLNQSYMYANILLPNFPLVTYLHVHVCTHTYHQHYQKYNLQFCTSHIVNIGQYQLSISTRPQIIFFFGGYFSHPIDWICNIEQAFTLQSMAIFRGSFLIFEGSFLHFGGEIARRAGAPVYFFPDIDILDISGGKFTSGQAASRAARHACMQCNGSI